MTPFKTRAIRTLAAVVVLGGAIAAAFLVPSGDVAVVPRDAVPLDGKVLIDGETSEFNGELSVVGVSEIDLSVGERVLYAFDDRVDVQRKVRTEDDEAADELRMEDSKDIAAALGLQAAGEDVGIQGSGALVLGVETGSPADGLLKRDDRIVSIDGVPVETAVDVTDAIGRLKPGTSTDLGIRRARLPQVVRVKTVPSEVDGRESRIGISVVTDDLEIDLPVKVSIDSGDVIGPSAGLPFAIAVYDAAERADLLKGRSVIATGEVALNGEVRPVGAARVKGIAAQEAGASLFVVPTANAEEAREGVQTACSEDDRCADVLGVDTFDQAIELLGLLSDELTPYLTT